MFERPSCGTFNSISFHHTYYLTVSYSELRTIDAMHFSNAANIFDVCTFCNGLNSNGQTNFPTNNICLNLFAIVCNKFVPHKLNSVVAQVIAIKPKAPKFIPKFIFEIHKFSWLLVGWYESVSEWKHCSEHNNAILMKTNHVSYIRIIANKR